MERLVRNTPHIEGNFTTHISFKISINLGKVEKLKEIIKEELSQDCSNIIEEVLQDKSPNSKYHISLSKTIYLKYHQISNFVSTFKKELSICSSLPLIVTPKVKYLNNEENSRFFVTLEILKNKSLNKLIGVVNEVLTGFGHAGYYDIENFIPHISILWCDYETGKKIEEHIPEEKLNNFIKEKSTQETNLKSSIEKGYLKILKLNEIYITIGNKVEVIKLA